MRQFVLAGLTLVLSVGAFTPRWAQAELPQRNLLVSWRLQSTDQAEQADRGLRHGEVRVDSRSGMSGQGVVTWSSIQGQDSRQGQMQLLVLNGSPARLTWSQQQPSVHWQFLATEPRSAFSPTGPQAQVPSQGPSLVPSQVQALGQTVWITREQGLRVRPVWAGGRSGVRLEFEVQSPMADALERSRPDAPAPQVHSSAVVLVPLDQWTVVARSGQQTQRQQRGTYASTEASQDGHTTLEIKVSLP